MSGLRSPAANAARAEESMRASGSARTEEEIMDRPSMRSSIHRDLVSTPDNNLGQAVRQRRREGVRLAKGGLVAPGRAGRARPL